MMYCRSSNEYFGILLMWCDRDVIELNVNQNLKIISGTVNVRVSGGVHNIYLNTNDRSFDWTIVSRLYMTSN